MNEGRGNNRNIFIYLGIVLALMAVLQFIVFPRITGIATAEKEVTYSEFLSMVDEGKVSTVEIDNATGRINFESPAETGGAAATVYYTGIVDDPGLVATLQAAKTAEGDAIAFGNVVPAQTNMLTNILPTLLMTGGLVVLMVFMTRSLSKRMGGDAMNFGKSGAKMHMQAQTDVSFDDVAGQEEAKDQLVEIVDFLHTPEKYKSVGAKMPKGALLVGPPGTGKTLLAKAVAGEAGVPFFSIAGSEFVEMFVGRGAARVRDLFKEAKSKSPCIVFIDELDTIGKKRDGSGLAGNDEREQTLNQLLSEMDGFDASGGVVILAATNRPETLDAALLRPGRFDRRVPVELPDLAGREAILRVHAKKVMMDTDVDYGLIARATAGASGADLANIINEGAILAVKNNRRIVTENDLMESVETVIAGQRRKSKVISPKEKKIIAYHEIGHALVAAKQNDTAPVTKITIIPRTSGALGYTMQVDEEEQNLLSREDAKNRIATLAGGRSAEELVFDTCTTGASNDIEKATKMARAMVTRYGMSKEFDMMALETVTNQYLGGDAALACGAETAAKIDGEVLSIIRTAHEKAVQILKDNMEKLHELSAYLLEKETITGEEFMAILNAEPGAEAEAAPLAAIEGTDAPVKGEKKVRAAKKPRVKKENEGYIAKPVPSGLMGV